MTPLRVVFDTNLFTHEQFSILDNSPIREHCKNGRVMPIYGHVFLEETFRAYGKERRREELLKQWLPFIADTAKFFCNDFNQIFHEELVHGRGPNARVFMPSRDFERMIQSIRKIPQDGSWKAWNATKVERDREEKKRASQREVSKSMRQEISDKIKSIPKIHRRLQLNTFIQNEIDSMGRKFIKALINTKNPIALGNQWSRDKARFPYFTTFVSNILYMGHHAMTKFNDPIDLNAQADLDLMTHLLNADVIVSNETGFLKTAFDDIWKPRGKVLFTSDEFVSFIQKI